MVMKILGSRMVNFTGSNGQPVSGHTLYLGYEDTADQETEGMKTEKVFVNSSVPIAKGLQLRPETIVNVEFNRQGKIVKIEPADEIDIG